LRKYLFIGAGGAIGAVFRYVIKEIPICPEIMPLNTLIVNVAGCFVLAVVLTVSIEILEFGPNLRLGIATGLIGAFTTFSTLCKETAELFYRGYAFSAIFNVVISAILGFAATYFGIAVATEVIIMRIKDWQNSKHDKPTDAESEED